MTACLASAALLLERENAFPIVFHADYRPAAFICFGHEGFGKNADVRIWKTAGRAIRVLARRIVVMHEHQQSRAIACLRPFEHLGIAARIPEGRVRPLADEHIDTDGLAGTVI